MVYQSPGTWRRYWLTVFLTFPSGVIGTSPISVSDQGVPLFTIHRDDFAIKHQRQRVARIEYHLLDNRHGDRVLGYGDVFKFMVHVVPYSVWTAKYRGEDSQTLDTTSYKDVPVWVGN